MNVEADLTVLQQILEQLLAGYWDWDIPTGEAFLSPTFKRMFGYDDHEIANHASSWQRLIFEEDLPGVLACFNKHVESKGIIPYYNEVRFRHKDGSAVWVVRIGKVIEWTAEGQPKRMVGCHIDITDRKKTDERLRESELIFSSFLLHSPIYVFFKDSEIRSLRLSRNFEQMLGIPIDQALGKSMDELFPPELAVPMIEDDRRVLASSRPVKVVEEFKGKTYETTKFSIRKDGQPKMLAGFTLDITERKAAEKRLRRAELRLRSLIEHTTDAVFCYEYDPPIPVDLPVEEQIERMYNCTLADCNLVCARSYGADSVEKVIGRSLRQLFGTTTHSLDKLFRDLIESGYRIIDGEAAEKLADGTERYFLNNGYGVVENGHLYRIWGTFRDITDRKKAEHELLKAQKLESLGILAGGIAHDFNNLLSGLFGYIDLALSRVKDNPEARNYLLQAHNCLSRTTDLTRQMLTFTKGGAPLKSVVSVIPILKESIQLSLSGSNVQCIFEPPSSISNIEADPGQMNQVFNNVLLNARQAMPNGGVVTIEVKDVERNTNVPPNRLNGKYLQIKIRDQGIGIPSDLIAKVCDPFYTTKQAGSGLGLATAYSIVSKHDGRLEIDSEMGVGTTVAVLLPITDKRVRDNVGGELAISEGGGDILIMDDDEHVRKVAGEMIRSLGYQAVYAKNGEEAVEVYKYYMSRGRKFETVVLDLTVVGGMGGAETIRALLEIDPSVKGIVSSGYSDSQVLTYPKKYGFVTQIAKPYRVKDIVRALRQLSEE